MWFRTGFLSFGNGRAGRTAKLSRNVKGRAIEADGASVGQLSAYRSLDSADQFNLERRPSHTIVRQSGRVLS